MRKSPIAAAAIAVGLLLAPNAMAATRFAGPGGNGDEPCADPANPCSIFRAADQAGGAEAGDEVVLAPGEYTDTALDLGPDGFVEIKTGVSVHGAAGQPRPVIRLERASVGGAFGVGANVTVSHLEIHSEVARTNVTVSSGGIVEDVIARSSSNVPLTIVCVQNGGLIRDSACLTSGAGATALGTNTLLSTVPLSARLRNVTAVATGPRSFGLNYRLFGAQGFDVLAKGVIARGDATDVFAAGLSLTPGTPGTGARVRIELDHSAYEDAGTLTDGGGTASVTLPGTAANIIEQPALAADGYHQLLGSPTIDKGDIDGSSGALDIDGQSRAVGVAPDIGADEFVPPQEPPIMPPEPTADPPRPSAGGEMPPRPRQGPLTNRPAPTTTIKRHPKARGVGRTATISFVSDQGDASFECKLNRRPFRRCASPFKVAVKPGRHTFRVRAIGAAGKADPTPAIFSWKVIRALR